MANTKVDHAPPTNPFGGPEGDQPSDNISHQSTSRPANAGHVYSADDKEYEKRTGGIEGGTLMAAPPESKDAPVPISKATIDKNAKQAEKENAERVSTTAPAGQGVTPARQQPGEFTTMRTPSVPPQGDTVTRKNPIEATK